MYIYGDRIKELFYPFSLIYNKCLPSISYRFPGNLNGWRVKEGTYEKI